MFSSLLLALCLTQEAPPQGQAGGAVAPVPAQQLTGVSPEARALWERLSRAARAAEGELAPITAFVLEAEVLTREGVQTNELTVDYRFLAPHFIRFKLPGGRETGRGPGEGRKSYWMKEGDELVVLDGRDDVQGRRLVDEMTSVARNYLALSDPSRIALTELALLTAPPTGVPAELRKEARDLHWLRVASPDFALLRGEARGGAPAAAERPIYEVELGLHPETSLPALAIIRPRGPLGGGGGGAPSERPEPMLIRLSKFREHEGFRLPFAILVHRLDPAVLPPAPPAFEPKPSQEIHVTRAELRPQLNEESFRP